MQIFTARRIQHKKCMNNFQSCFKVELYLEPCKTSMVELFAKIIPLIFLHKSSEIEFSQGYKHAKAKQKRS